MAAMVYMAALYHGSTRLGIIIALAVVSLWWLIDEGFMIKYISTLPSDDKAPVMNEVSAKESWLKLCKKYDVLDDEQKSVEGKGKKGLAGKDSAAVVKKEEKDSAKVAKKEEKAFAAVAKKSTDEDKKVAKKHFRSFAKKGKRVKKSTKTATKKIASVEKSASDSDSVVPQGISDEQDSVTYNEADSSDNSSTHTVSEFRDYFDRFKEENHKED
jgi:hypothetical protein